VGGEERERNEEKGSKGREYEGKERKKGKERVVVL